MPTLDQFTTGYVIAALWSSHDDRDGMNDAPLDEKFDITDIAETTLQQMIADCAKFQAEQWDTMQSAFESPDYRRIPDSTELQTAGHDFWLTRNHHGAGFWDGDYPKAEADKLTSASHAFGEVNLYVGDDDKIYA